MKKIDIILLSFLVIGTAYGETNDQHLLTKKLNKEKLNHSVEALVKIMREIEVKKEEAGGISDTVCKTFVPRRCALVGGIVNSLNAMLFYASDFHFFQKKIKMKLEDQLTISEIVERGMVGFILGSIGSWVVAKILFGLCDSRRIKRNIEKNV